MIPGSLFCILAEARPFGTLAEAVHRGVGRARSARIGTTAEAVHPPRRHAAFAAP